MKFNFQLQHDSDLQVQCEKQDDQEVVAHSSGSTVLNATPNDGEDLLDSEELIDQTVREMLENFEKEQQEEWLDSIMHDFDQ